MGASTNMVCIELDKHHINKEGRMEPKFKVAFRVEIPRGDFTYTKAVDKIIELNEIYDFDWIAIDRGYGEVQVELLHKFGMANPESGLCDKIVPYQYAEKIEVRDPHTRKKEKKDIKPFMVNNSVMVFERGAIILHPDDKPVVRQFEGYRIKSISSTGRPTYDSNDEHMVDCINMALLTFERKYGDLFKRMMKEKVYVIDQIIPDNENISRESAREKNKKSAHVAVSFRNRNKGREDIYIKESGRNGFSSIRRSNF